MRYTLAVLLLLPTAAFAWEEPPPPPPPDPDLRTPRIIYKDRTEIDFETVDVTVPITRPSVGLVAEIEHKGFNPLFHYRENFDPEMVQSIDSIK